MLTIDRFYDYENFYLIALKMNLVCLALDELLKALFLITAIALTWLSEHPSVTIYDNIERFMLYTHDGKTEVEMLPDFKEHSMNLNRLLKTFLSRSLCI